MKKQNFFHIKSILFYVCLILLIASSFDSVYAQTKKKPPPRITSTDILPMPSEPELREMVETTLLDFNDAVERADFNDFYASICVPWQKETSVKELQEIFQAFIDKAIDISDISGMEAVFSSKPIIKKELGYNTLILKGYYPTSPNTTKFDLNFIPEEELWKLSSIRVNTKAD